MTVTASPPAPALTLDSSERRACALGHRLPEQSGARVRIDVHDGFPYRCSPDRFDADVEQVIFLVDAKV